VALRIGLLTISDTRTREQDTAGAALHALCEKQGWDVVVYHLVPDDRERITEMLVGMADLEACDVILTAGGTGLGPRDITPEATAEVSDRIVPGIAEAIRHASLAITGRAMLSRATAGVRGHTLIINLPGSEKAVRECLGLILRLLPHAVEMLRGGGHDMKEP
jgi:molybdopterin adenylyltransferase